MSFPHFGSVSALRRYPVKSLIGEQLESIYIESRGLKGDRLWAVEDEAGKFGSGKTTRRFRMMNGLLALSARYEGEQPFLGFPDGRDLPADSDECAAALSDLLAQTVRVTREDHISHFDEGPVHLVATSALTFLSRVRDRAVEPTRLRYNVLLDTPGLDGHVEANWVGKQMTLGDTVELEVVKLMPRCVMVNMAQRGMSADNEILKAVAKVNADVCFGVLANVIVPGEVHVGDTATLASS